MAKLYKLMVTQEQAELLSRALRQLGNFSGPGITVGPDGISFNPPQTPAPPGRPPGDRAQFCLVKQNGVDPNGDPKYDIFELDDTDFSDKLNEEAVVPENYRSPDFDYTAGVSGIYQIDGDGLFFLFVCDEAPACP